MNTFKKSNIFLAGVVRSVTEALEALGAEVRACEIGRADIRYDGGADSVRTAIEDRGFDVTAVTEM